jgi:tetratricopeptide (TPR) repeat protein
LATNPNLSRARYQLAICLFGLGERDAAEKEFEQVKIEAPDERGALYYLGRLRLLAGDADSAIRILQPLARDPPFPDTSFYLACAWLDKGQIARAVAALEQSARLSPRDYRIPYRLARAYARAGRAADATREFERSSMLREQYNTAARDAVQCGAALDSGKDDTPCRRMFDPTDPDKLTMLGIIYGQHGAFERSLEPLIAASKLDSDSFEIFHNLGVSHFRLKMYENARLALERAVRLRPDFFGSNALLGAVLFTLKDDAAAYQVLSHAHALDPSNADVADLLFKTSLSLAGQSFTARDYSKATGYLRAATDLRPTDAALHRKLADLYVLTGETALSATETKRAEELEAGHN